VRVLQDKILLKGTNCSYSILVYNNGSSCGIVYSTIQYSTDFTSHMKLSWPTCEVVRLPNHQ